MNISEEGKKKDLIGSNAYQRRLANRDAIQHSYYKERSLRAVRALENNGFAAAYADSKDEALRQVLDIVPMSATVGCGGSMTVREIGVLDALEKRGHRIFDHWKAGLSPDDVMETRRAQLTCDVFLTSANALTSDGELVCCDGSGNRIAAMTFGPRKVIVIVGANKIVKDVDAALHRIKDVAAPQALREIGLDLPCLKTGACQDCQSPARGCRITLIMERKPYNTDVTVLVVGQSLGF